jgi:hypothetical protein
MTAADTPTIQGDGAGTPADPVARHGRDPGARPPRRRPAPQPGPYSRLKQRLDRRSRLGRRAAAFERALAAQLGGAPSAAETALIRLAVTLDARIELMRARLLATEAGDERAERHLLAWCNSLAKTLRTLGLKAAPRRPPALADILAGCGAAREA